MSQRAEVAKEAVLATPVVAGLATPKILGFEWSEVTYALGALYIVVQIGYLLHRWFRMARRPNTRRFEEVDE